MNSEKFQDAMGEIRDDYIADAHSEVKKKNHGAAWGAIAACLCVAVGAVTFFGGGTKPVKPVETAAPRDYYYYVPTAELAASVFEQTERDGVKGTNQYTRVYARDISELAPDTFETPEALNIYSTSMQSPDAAAAEAFFLSHLPQFQELCGMSASEYELGEESYDGETVYTAFVQELNGEGFKLIALNAKSGDMCIYSGGSERMSFDGRLVSVPSDADDGQIRTALAEYAEYLNALFGTDYGKMSVTREYSYDGLHTVSVYLYSDSESDCIELSFHPDRGEGRAYHWGEDRTNAYLTSVILHEGIGAKENAVIGTGRALSLEEAEELLYKGFVFGGHSCPLCMAAQAEVSFEGYEAVKLEYVSGGGYSVPFYAFYKSLGVNEHGMQTYAKTYVCAIELEGTEEYFNAQTAYHSVIDS